MGQKRRKAKNKSRVKKEEAADKLTLKEVKQDKERQAKKGCDCTAQYGSFCLDCICNAFLGSAHIYTF